MAGDRVADRLFPPKDLLLAAWRGLPGTRTHPVLEAAAELALLYQAHGDEPAAWGGMGGRRVRLVGEIDRWVTIAAPPPRESARVHPESVGQALDQLAQLTVRAYVALADAPDAAYQDACAVAAGVAEGYQDLIAEVADGRVQLPAPPPPS
ncbi:hypothetical protein BJY24_005754 [Nocardia transvalensis]|uniref:DUF4254 domain-containing protein n=1 Tax=Nocardia transvalensis TaxID=37333 RepID=A0A7W9PIS6_9NOCA|nr:hypothetical protein [Nocardia transvalensis]MBB5916842.1 hypothetical protein [Nocardia transvalensis]